jgi:hypothetical protein
MNEMAFLEKRLPRFTGTGELFNGRVAPTDTQIDRYRGNTAGSKSSCDRRSI